MRVTTEELLVWIVGALREADSCQKDKCRLQITRMTADSNLSSLELVDVEGMADWTCIFPMPGNLWPATDSLGASDRYFRNK
jgi:hypothetical protein